MSDENECPECPPPAPAWLATFADLMSLLMCFFVLLLSFSEMDAMKFKRLAGSMAQAFGVQNKLNVTDIPKGTSIIAQEFSPSIPEPTPINEIWQKTEMLTHDSLDHECSEEYNIEHCDEDLESGVKARVKQKLEELVEQTRDDAMLLAESLSDQISAGEIEIETHGRKIIIRIREKGSFKSGSAELADDYYDILAEIRAVVKEKSGSIQVQGHTDNIPIRSRRFRSNWELSSSRAVSVAHELINNGEINPRRFEVAGYSSTRPLVNEDTPEARARNRRVEIVIRQGIDNEITEEEKQLLQDDQGEDILKDLDLDPGYLFELAPEEIF